MVLDQANKQRSSRNGSLADLAWLRKW